MKRGCLTWVVIGATVYGSAASPAAASPQLSQKAGCAACHAIDQKSLGPSYQAIAQRYRGRADAPALLAERVRKGSQGVWGAVPMPPTAPDRLRDAELKALVAWLLKTP